MARAVLSRYLVAGLAALLLLAAPAAVRADDAARDEFYRSLGGGLGGARALATESEGPTALLVTGMIGVGSYDEFRAALMHGNPDLVVLEGPGGILGEALLIGEEVRRRNLSTVVRPNRSCASACAIVFLSGRTKYLGDGAVVGLHAASTADGRADPQATAVMAAYLRGVGVPGSTLKRMARTAPKDIRWLTKAEQKAVGIQTLSAAQ